MNTALPEDAHDPADEPRVYLRKGVAVSIIGTFIILTVAALYYARAFFLPLVLASLITLTFMPMVRWLHRRGIPLALSAILIVVTIGVVVGSAALVLADPVAKMVADAPQVTRQLNDRFDFLKRPMAMLVEAGQQVQKLAEPATPDGTQKVVIAQSGLVAWAADTLTGIGTTIGATLILTVFLLSSSDGFLQKIVRAVPSLSDKKRSLRIVHDVEFEISRYLITITGINIVFGALVGTMMAFYGMPNPLVWAVAAAMLNYVPYVGSITGIGLTTVIAVVTFPTLTLAALPPITYLGLHLLESTFFTPLVLGRRLELNAVAVLVALAFGGWLWGIVGALIAVPMLVVIKAFCDHFPGLATFGDFLSAEVPPELSGTPAAAEEESVAADTRSSRLSAAK
jgi:predicted PurR-regulated permease PerM